MINFAGVDYLLWWSPTVNLKIWITQHISDYLSTVFKCILKEHKVIMVLGKHNKDDIKGWFFKSHVMHSKTTYYCIIYATASFQCRRLLRITFIWKRGKRLSNEDITIINSKMFLKHCLWSITVLSSAMNKRKKKMWKGLYLPKGNLESYWTKKLIQYIHIH